MIAIVAGARDTDARRLAERLPGGLVLTPADLSRPGWELCPGEPARGAAGDGEIADGELDGVVTRLSWVELADLSYVHAEDREFVAAEMTAFLSAWLAGLRCPVVNPPGGASLCGPGWSRARWAATAARLGIPVAPQRRRSELGRPHSAPAPPAATVSVIGDRCSGDGGPELADATRRLARCAGVPALRAHFDARGRLRTADPWVDVDDDAVAAELERLLEVS